MSPLQVFYLPLVFSLIRLSRLVTGRMSPGRVELEEGGGYEGGWGAWVGLGFIYYENGEWLTLLKTG